MAITITNRHFKHEHIPIAELGLSYFFSTQRSLNFNHTLGELGNRRMPKVRFHYWYDALAAVVNRFSWQVFKNRFSNKLLFRCRFSTYIWKCRFGDTLYPQFCTNNKSFLHIFFRLPPRCLALSKNTVSSLMPSHFCTLKSLSFRPWWKKNIF